MTEKKYFHDVIEEENKDWQENKNPLVRLFYKIKFKKVVKYAQPTKEELILDFGCGKCWLKKNVLPEYNIVGYDIDPKLTEVEDYKNLKPNLIFAIDVFEHIPRKEIRKIIRTFKYLESNPRLVTVIPTETWLWRKARKIMGLSERVADHITPLKEIVKLLQEEYTEVKKINLFFMSRISLWKRK